MSIEKKVAVITGGNGTLGSAIAKGLAQQGILVIILGRNAEKSKAVVESMSLQGINIESMICDVLDETSVHTVVKEIVNKTGRIDILVNAAGGNMAGATIGLDQSIMDLNLEDFRKVNDLNLLGTVIPTIAVAKAMAEQKKGCVINISSMAASIPLTRVVGYSAAKAAVDSFTKWMAVELATKINPNIRVNAIAPGFFIADQNRSLLLQADGSYTSRGNTIIQNTPMRRFGEPDELISTIQWLCSDASTFITGIVVPVDGGFSAFAGV